MTHSTRDFLSRFFALFIALTLTLPGNALALREIQTVDSGLEEQELTAALRGPAPAATLTGLEEKVDPNVVKRLDAFLELMGTIRKIRKVKPRSNISSGELVRMALEASPQAVAAGFSVEEINHVLWGPLSADSSPFDWGMFDEMDPITEAFRIGYRVGDPLLGDTGAFERRMNQAPESLLADLGFRPSYTAHSEETIPQRHEYVLFIHRLKEFVGIPAAGLKENFVVLDAGRVEIARSEPYKEYRLEKIAAGEVLLVQWDAFGKNALDGTSGLALVRIGNNTLQPAETQIAGAFRRVQGNNGFEFWLPEVISALTWYPSRASWVKYSDFESNPTPEFTIRRSGSDVAIVFNRAVPAAIHRLTAPILPDNQQRSSPAAGLKDEAFAYQDDLGNWLVTPMMLYFLVIEVLKHSNCAVFFH